jgi:hypothetical protein
MRADILRGERCGSRIGIGKQKQIGKPGSSARLAILWIPSARLARRFVADAMTT